MEDERCEKCKKHPEFCKGKDGKCGCKGDEKGREVIDLNIFDIINDDRKPEEN